MTYDRMKAKKGATRGRFEVTKNDDGWILIDWKWSLTIGGHDTKKAALEAKSFVIAYTKKWGDINFSSFPYGLDQEPSKPSQEDTAMSADEEPPWHGPREAASPSNAESPGLGYMQGRGAS